MRVFKDTPLEFSMMTWELEPPHTSLMVLVKGTFELVPGAACRLADEQDPARGPLFHGGGESSSVAYESDYAIFKPRGEWYLTGSAYAVPAPATVVPVSVRVGELKKRLLVWGDRHWKASLLGSAPSDPVPFDSMTLSWERAFGGPSVAANPVGRGTAPVEAEAGSVVPLANLESLSGPVLSRSDRPAPIGMFPLGMTWAQRVSRTGTFDERWRASRWPFFPEDFELSFFNCAPRDQQIEGYWRGDEPIELEGLHPSTPKIRSQLPGLRARCFVEWAEAAGARRELRLAPPVEPPSEAEVQAEGVPRLQEVSLSLDTLVIDSARQRVICQWRGLTRVADDELTNVARLFFVHEPLEAERPLTHYEARLRELVLEEARDMDGPADPLALPEAGAVDASAAGSASEATDQAAAELRAAREAFDVMLSALDEMVPPTPMPTVAQARASLEQAGVEPPAELQEPPEVAPRAPGGDSPPSLVRLVAIGRRRLGRPFEGLDLSGAPLRGLDLSGADLSGALLTGADLRGVKLDAAKLQAAVLYEATLDGASLRGADLSGAELSGVSARQVDLTEAVMQETFAVAARFDGSSFMRADLLGAVLSESSASRADFRQCRLDHADLTACDLYQSDFMQASLLHTSLESCRADQARFDRCAMADLRASDGASFRGARFVLVDAPNAQFQGTLLQEVNFSGSNLEGADFSQSDLSACNLSRCRLVSAVFDRSVLRRSVFIGADLFEAAFQKADLTDCDFRGSNLFGVDTWRAVVDHALFEGANLERSGLEAKTS